MGKALHSFVALGLGTVLAVAVGESLLAHSRLIDTPPGQFRSNPVRAFEHTPLFKGRDHFGNPIVINSRGMRDREFALEKPVEDYRILVLGDSVAFGYGVKAGESFSKQLETLLNEKKTGVEVLNAGIRGYNTYQELQLLEEIGFSFHPDLVILFYVTNDAEPFTRQSGLIDKKHDGLIRFKNYVKQHSYLYAFFRKNLEVLRHRMSPEKFTETYDDQFDLRNPGWLASHESMKEMKMAADKHGAHLLMAVCPRMEWAEGQYPAAPLRIHRQILDAARKLDIDTIDLLPPLMKYDAKKLKITEGDSFHPNVSGHKLIAEILADRIRNFKP